MEPRVFGDPGRVAVRRRRLLGAWVKAVLLAGTAVFAGVFAYGLLGPAPVSEERIHVGSIPEGSGRLASWDGGRVWIVHRSPRQVEALEADDGASPAPGGGTPAPVDNEYRSVDRRYGVYLASTDRPGILIQYTRSRPDRLEAGRSWDGGFVDPASGALFDLAGRPYGGGGEWLAVPPHRFADAGVLELGRWE